MRKPRMLATLLAVAMLVTVLAACGNSTTTTTPGTTTTTPGTTTTTPGTTTPGTTTPATPTASEKVYRTYLTADIPLMNAHDYTDTSIETPIFYCLAGIFRPVPDDDGNGYHYVGDMATDLPELVKTEENQTHTKYVQETQADGTSIYKPEEETVTLTTWQWTIRDGMTWHNGETLDAEDLVYSWKMLMDPVLSNRMANFLYNNGIVLYNGEKYFRGDCEWEDVGIKVLPDGKTMQIIAVGTPDQSSVMSHFNSRVCYPVYEPFYEAGMSADRTETTYGDTLEHWMGCGPYIFEEWAQNNKMVYRKNPNYWLADLFHFDVVEVYIVKEQNAAVQMFEAGKLDDLTPNADTIETYLEDPRMVSYSSIYIPYIEINDGSSPVKNENNPIADTLEWRKCIYHAIDRETIAKQFMGHMEPAGWYVNGEAGMLSPNAQTYRESEWGKKVEELVASWSAPGHTTGYNPDLARQYLKEALAKKGLPEDTHIECIFITDTGSPSWSATAQWLDVQFDEIFNGQVDLTLTVFPEEMSYTNAKKTYAWDLNNNNWGRAMSRFYPYESFYYFSSGYPSHPNWYLSSRYDEQFDYCRSIQNESYDKILEETYKLEMIYLEEVINCPVYQRINYTLFSNRLKVPVNTYIPGFGWGTMFGDIVE